MLVIGLCGASGAGKSTAQAYFAKLGIPGIDTDLLYRELTATPSPCTAALAKTFGEEILLPNGALDRHALSQLVFCGGEGQKERLSRLNRITHTVILDECRKWLKEQKNKGVKAALINAPLLFESDFHKECDLTLAILSSPLTKCRRIIERDGLDEEAAFRRLASQHDDDFLAKNTDFQIVNDCSPEELQEKIYAFCQAQKLLTEE